MADYGFRKVVAGSMDEVVERTKEALKGVGFGTLFDLNVAGILKEKIGHERRPYRILGACNPRYAAQSLQIEEELGLLLPCNVIVYENEAGQTVVSMIDPQAMLGVPGNPALTEVAGPVKELMQQALDAI
ncbi:MAG: ABC transporter ATP-binding protein [Alphaproteobacteria bacterium CG_4_10_14_0_2_um_filter_63_37]|nr:MAG: ABC transporter ATP-binding protein [Proteobacteria bacterium CG1_02_64_396]PJA24530.1 MAG: ABC transporter ATP-binding protein [Alphaproteobacteria bacterium CG_4_10_14_0_2_um_filter_63_37]